jgi:CheY-like chemotaxis protein
VLAAEDNPTNQLVLKALLAGVGLELTMVSNGKEAFEAWRAGEWDVVLMDVQMPIMDGIAAVRLVRDTERREGLRRTPVIAVTANASAYDRAEYVDAGMDDLVVKPINIAGLLKAIKDLVDSSPASAASQTTTRDESESGGHRLLPED